jgi:hypothetical protein
VKKPLLYADLFANDIHEEIKNFVSKYKTYMPEKYDSVFNRLFSNDVSFFQHIHSQLSPVASEIFGAHVKPSYSFLSMYQNGGKCPLHIDRRQCRYTIDYLIQQTNPKPWKIRISDQLSDLEVESFSAPEFSNLMDESTRSSIIQSNQWHTFELQPNEAVCYSGTHSWHYRPDELEGEADLVFFHFVDDSFEGSLR